MLGVLPEALLPGMDYKQLFDRWVMLATLPEEDRKSLVESMHEEVTTSVQAFAGLGAVEMDKILKGVEYPKREIYIKTVAPVLALAAFDGYLLALMEKGVNPQTADLVSRESTKGLGERWSVAYGKDQNISILQKIDPITGLILSKMQEVRVNQMLSFYPEIIDLPYKITEKLHQYIGWAVHQGYVLGVMEQE